MIIKLHVTNSEISMYYGRLDSVIVFNFVDHVKPFYQNPFAKILDIGDPEY